MQLDQQQLDAFDRDGVIKVEQLIEQSWVDRMLAVVDSQLANPSEWANDGNRGASRNRMFTDRYQWKTNSEINAYIRETPLAKVAAQAMQSETARFYFEHMIVKEPGTTAPTPWHQDVPYWPFLGRQICSIWVALTASTIEQSAMEFVAGSHKDGNYYRPEAFSNSDDNPNAAWQKQGQGMEVPDIQSRREDFDIVGWDVEPGDAIVFSAWMLHWAPGNSSQSKRRAAISTRWLGDDAVWHPHSGADPTISADQVNIDPGDYPCDDAVFPLLWPA